MTVIGVMPSGFSFPLGSQDTAYAPFRFSGATADVTSGSHFMRTIGRLRPSATVESAGADMNRVLADYARIDPDSAGRKMQVQAVAKALLGDTRALLRLLLLAVLAILALGCLNIAGLMLVRGIRREREIALRSAIGASRGRLAQQLAAEIILLALVGTCGGGATAWALLHATHSLLTASLARGAEVALRPAVMLASLCAALVTLLVAGMLPARQLFSVSPLAALRSGSAATGTSRGQRRLGAIFIGTQIALAMVLLLTSGLLLQSLLALRTTDLLFPTDHLLIEDVNLSPGAIAGRNLMQTFYTPLLEQVRAIPGVRSAAIINMLPVQDYGFNSDVQIVGQPPAPKDREVLAEVRFVSPSYYQTLGAKLLRGRLLDDQLDTAGSQSVIVVNEAFVKKFFQPGEDPIGRQIADFNHSTIVGVVSDQRQTLYRPPLAEMDLAVTQLPPAAQRELLQEMQLVLRTNVDPLSIAEPLRHVMQGLDPGLPFRPALTMGDILNESLVTQRMEGWLFGAFATLAVLLALLGLYGLIAQQVEQSRRETGVRMALGAQRWNVLLHWMGRVAGISLTGLAAGLALSFALHKIIASVLSVQGKNEAATAAMLMGLMEIFALAAAMIPARRAASIDPMQALRAE
jgi:predicted permease